MSDGLTPEAMAERTDALHRTIPMSGDVLRVRDFCKMMGMERSSATSLIRRCPTFPARKVGGIYVIRRSELHKWLNDDVEGIRWRKHRIMASRWTNPII